MDIQLDADSVSRHKRLGSAPGRYLRGLLCGAATGLAALGALYIGVAQTEYLPPPPLSNTLCIDEKLAFLRDHPRVDPDFLVVGSSIAWRNIDSSVLARKMPGSQPLNGAFCGMRLHQATAAAEWLIERWPSINEVLLVAGPQDFRDCREPATAFDFEHATQFVFEQKAAWRFHLRYFDPVSFVRNAVLRFRKPNDHLTQARATALTSYGDGPIEARGSKLGFGYLPRLDQLCFDSLRTFASKLSNQGRALMVVSTPLHPEWKATYDAAGTVRGEFEQRMSRALSGTQAAYWNADEAGIVNSGEAFFDAVHMRWAAAHDLTEQILNTLHRDDRGHIRGDSASVKPCWGSVIDDRHRTRSRAHRGEPAAGTPSCESSNHLVD